MRIGLSGYYGSKCTLLTVLLAASILALSSMEYAQAQTPALNTGAPLYMKSVMPEAACTGSASSTSVAPTLSAAGLAINHTITGTMVTGVTIPNTVTISDYVSYIEVSAQSTGDAIGVYGYSASGATITATVPRDALMTISGDIDMETFTIKPVFASVEASRGVVDATRFINNTNIAPLTYGGLPIFLHAHGVFVVTSYGPPIVGNIVITGGVQEVNAGIDAGPTICTMGQSQLIPPPAYLVPVDVGPPLYMKFLETPTETACTGALTGTALLTPDSLYASHAVKDHDSFVKTSYIEVSAQSTGLALAVYNFDVPEDDVASITVPIDALRVISENPSADTFTTRSVLVTIPYLGMNFVFLDNTNIPVSAVDTFPSTLEKLNTNTIILRLDDASDGYSIVAPISAPSSEVRITPAGEPSTPCYTSSATALPHYFSNPVITPNTCSPEQLTTAGTVTTSGLLNLDGSLDISIKDFSAIAGGKFATYYIITGEAGSVSVYNYNIVDGALVFTLPKGGVAAVTANPLANDITVRAAYSTTLLTFDASQHTVVLIQRETI
ncbi:MAG: hypothetical protein EB830_04440, partial [Nitrosopumilus sp. H13]